MRIGIVGAGKIGQLRARSIKEHGTTELRAVLDVSAESARKAVARTQALPLTNPEEFFGTAMDAVIISTPVHTHEELCLKAFHNNFHVLCEKPLSNTVESCQRIVDAAVAADRVLAVGFNLRYYPFVSFIKDSIDSGTIGDVDHIRVFGGHEGLPKFACEWEYKAPISGGGALMDVGIHMTDLARYFLGEITEVVGIATEKIWHVEGSEDNAVVLMRNPEGIPAIYQATWSEWQGYECYVEVYGNRGMVRGSYAPMKNILITQDEPGAPRKKKTIYYPDILVKEKLFSWQVTALKSFKQELGDFVALINGSTETSIADGYAGLRSVEVAAAVRQSSENREVIHLPVLGQMQRG